MNAPNHKSFKTFWLTFPVLLAALVFGGGCSNSKPTPDPLAGFHFSSLNNLHSNEAIVADYQGYIQTLSADERKFAGPVDFFENGTGRHAVQIQIALYGTWWYHVLIYDKDNKRIKVTKYSPGHYSS